MQRATNGSIRATFARTIRIWLLLPGGFRPTVQSICIVLLLDDVTSSVQRSRCSLTRMTATCRRLAGMGCQVMRGWIIILAMALALTSPRDCMAGRSPQAGAPRLRRSHDEMLQTPALPLHEAPQALLITHKASASPGTASAYEGDFRHSSDVLFTRQKSAAAMSEL